MLQNDLFAAGTGTGPCKSSMPRAVALERSALAFSCELALVIILGSATATRTNARGGSPIGAACGTQRRRFVQKLMAMGSGSGFPRLVNPYGTP